MCIKQKKVPIIIFFIMLIVCTYGGYVKADWESFQPASFSDGKASSSAMAIAPDGTPYVAYSDSDHNNKATVLKYNNLQNCWDTVGSAGFSAGSIQNLSMVIATDGTPYITYMDYQNGDISVIMKYDSSQNCWEDLGHAGLSDGFSNSVIAIAPDNIPYVVYSDPANDYKLTAANYNSSENQWNTIGNAGFSDNAIQNLSLLIDSNGIPYVAYQYFGNNNKIIVMKYNSLQSHWDTIGLDDSYGNIAYPSLAIAPDGTPYVAYSDSDHDNKATVVKYNNSGNYWDTVGPANFSPNRAVPVISISQDGTPYVAYTDWDNGFKATVLKYNNLQNCWYTVGSAGFSARMSDLIRISIAPDGTPYVIYISPDDDYKSSMMRFPTYSVSLSQTDAYTFAAQLEDYASIPPQSITATKTGPGDITNLEANLSGADANDFTLVPLDSNILNSTTTSAAFTIQPKNNLSVGTHTATVTVTADHDLRKSFVVNFTVNSAYTIDLSQASTYTFPSQTEGYSSIPAQNITATKTGPGDITNLAVNLIGTNANDFILGTLDLTTLNSTTPAAFTIKPKDGLSAGTHTATVAVTADHGVNKSFDVSFTVNPAPYIPPYIPPTPTTETRQVPVVVENGSQQNNAVQQTITRTTDTNGSKKDTAIFDKTTAIDTVKKALENSTTTADIIMTDIPGNTADKIEFKIPGDSAAQLSNNNMTLKLKTEKAYMDFPAETIAKLKGQDTTVKINEEKDSNKISDNKGLILKLVSGAEIISPPLDIEANFTGRIKITIPIDASKLPASQDELNKLLSTLEVMVHHSDGTDVIDKGTIAYDEKGKPIGISIWVDKFSSFTLIKVPDSCFKGKTTIMKDKVESNKEWSITFTKEANAATLNKDNVYVVDSKGNKMDVKLSYGSDSILKVTPVNPYISGETYCLCFSKAVESINGTSLFNESRYQFIIK